MQYRISKCPHCGFQLEFLRPDWTAFGDPRTKCPKCSKTIVFDNVAEWDVRSPGEKLLLIFQHYFWASSAVAVAITIAFAIITGSSGNGPLLTVWLVSLIATAAYRHNGFMREVQESKARTQNPEYLKQMKELRPKGPIVRPNIG